MKPTLRAFPEQLYLIKIYEIKRLWGIKLKMGLEGNTEAKSKLFFWSGFHNVGSCDSLGI